jgi:hypothetical protein
LRGQDAIRGNIVDRNAMTVEAKVAWCYAPELYLYSTEAVLHICICAPHDAAGNNTKINKGRPSPCFCDGAPYMRIHSGIILCDSARRPKADSTFFREEHFICGAEKPA